jgi:hypothetical protein
LGECFQWAALVKITEVTHFGATFYCRKSHELIVTTKLVGRHFGPFFTNSSGHPGAELTQPL